MLAKLLIMEAEEVFLECVKINTFSRDGVQGWKLHVEIFNSMTLNLSFRIEKPSRVLKAYSEINHQYRVEF